MEIRFTIDGDPKPKKNSQRVIMCGGRPRIIQSKQYLEYEHSAVKQCRERCTAVLISDPVNVKAVYYRQTRRTIDITNLEAALMDILVKSGVLEDDNCTIVVSTDGSRVHYDKEHPRTEVIITPSEECEREFKK